MLYYIDNSRVKCENKEQNKRGGGGRQTLDKIETEKYNRANKFTIILWRYYNRCMSIEELKLRRVVSKTGKRLRKKKLRERERAREREREIERERERTRQRRRERRGKRENKRKRKKERGGEK